MHCQVATLAQGGLQFQVHFEVEVVQGSQMLHLVGKEDKGNNYHQFHLLENVHFSLHHPAGKHKKNQLINKKQGMK